MRSKRTPASWFRHSWSFLNALSAILTTSMSEPQVPLCLRSSDDMRHIAALSLAGYHQLLGNSCLILIKIYQPTVSFYLWDMHNKYAITHCEVSTDQHATDGELVRFPLVSYTLDQGFSNLSNVHPDLTKGLFIHRSFGSPPTPSVSIRSQVCPGADAPGPGAALWDHFCQMYRTLLLMVPRTLTSSVLWSVV